MYANDLGDQIDGMERFSPSWSCQQRSVGRTEAAGDEVQAEYTNHCALGRRKE
jgi:hypothetical protein